MKNKSFQAIESQYLQLLSFNGIMRNLYSDKITFDILSKTAPGFFGRIQVAILEKIILGISKLLDPCIQSGYKNITLFTLIDEISVSDSDYSLKLKSKALAIKVKAKKIISLRNKIIAHSDYESATAKIIEYKGATHDQIIEIISDIGEFLDDINIKINGGLVTYYGDSGTTDIIERLEEYCEMKGIEITKVYF